LLCVGESWWNYHYHQISLLSSVKFERKWIMKFATGSVLQEFLIWYHPCWFAYWHNLKQKYTTWVLCVDFIRWSCTYWTYLKFNKEGAISCSNSDSTTFL
jgi:hypothetical protein